MEINSQLKFAILSMLRQLGISVDDYRETNGNLQLHCPFAGVYDSPHTDGMAVGFSFGIKVTDKGIRYNCFSCGKRGSSLIDLINMLIKYDVIKNKGDAYSIQNSIQLKFPKYYEKISHEEKEDFDLDLSSYENLNTEFYDYNINKRGLERTTIKECGLLYDEFNKRIVFPCRDKSGKIVGSVDHSIEGKGVKYSNNFNTGKYLDLEWLIKGKCAVVVEGMYDSRLTYQHIRNLGLTDKYSVVGMFGAEITPMQIKKLVRYFDRLILMGDNDEAGIKMEHTIWKKAHKQIPLIMRVNYIGKDPGTIKDINKFKKYFDNLILFNSLGNVDSKY